MKNSLLFLSLIFFYSVTYGQTESQEIKEVLFNYINGTSYNKPELIEKAFYPEADLFLDNKENNLWIVPIKEYQGWYKNKKQGDFNGRIGNIVSIDYTNNIATAKVEILFPDDNSRYIDLFILKKIDNKWKIISKAATKDSGAALSDKILFIVSNAAHYGNSDISTGNSFSELVNAYSTFKSAGYTVDFVSPEGGTIPLSYIDTSDSLSMSYLYNSDFMYALKHTHKPSEIAPQNYKAVHYIGGGAAMYGVPESQEIQKIAMAIYEQHNGIISSVCHGTAGIVNLKTKDGKYLFKNKLVSGYPDSFEKKDAAYFKHFPFLIQKTLEDRGAVFKFSPRNNSHVEVDGRLITGQNYLSSRDVALKIIEQLKVLN
ncbi:nuclear transport factor 2 family protein [Dokdonia donghaensis]|uniref:Peptidase n=1 Tax=Dokdonia donghaensis DSW-1 TaxID=1300343 RepID=A0A0A2GQH2_9FLAO|nr:nuclear transport factor 2 family protein [Dokdonia donghaensis]ANH61379.1 Molecular chaperone Hsp31 and glyoxalase 3 [Dokdonia donghaensis DSW-1]KGO05437.1 peptidase [Dokdonia donghaensis DSW-1]